MNCVTDAHFSISSSFGAIILENSDFSPLVSRRKNSHTAIPSMATTPVAKKFRSACLNLSAIFMIQRQSPYKFPHSLGRFLHKGSPYSCAQKRNISPKSAST
jgi:hypothetical protein